MKDKEYLQGRYKIVKGFKENQFYVIRIKYNTQSQCYIEQVEQVVKSEKEAIDTVKVLKWGKQSLDWGKGAE